MSRRWSFVRAGGFDQVNLRSGADLVALRDLDQKLWVALACPVQGLEFDERTLSLIDSDGDGRVRASELIDAAEWAGQMLADVELLAGGHSEVPLAKLDTSHDEGAQLAASAKRVLTDLGRPEATAISVDDAVGALAAFDATPFNGDGIITVASAGEDEALVQLVNDVLACSEPQTDRSGEPGIDAGLIDAFYDAVTERNAWTEAGQGDEVHVLGDDTASAFAALGAVRAKVDDFFARCRVASFDPRALEAVNRQQSEYLEIAAQDLQVTADEVRHFPLAMVEPGKDLPLGDGVNPAWAAEMTAFRSQVVGPTLGEVDALTEEAWSDVQGRFGAYAAWVAAEAGQAVAGLDADRLGAIQQASQKDALTALVARDEEAAPVAAALESVERLVRYVRDLMPLANNFVAFRDFYARSAPATFQAGTLYLDQRACELCIYVNDAGKHAKLAPLSSAYLLYCSLKNAKGQTRNVVAAMTNGDVDNLMVGRNGVFYDRDGNDWDATITKIIENPISIRQAFWTPYKRFLRAVEGLISSRAASAAKAAETRATSAAGEVSTATGGGAVTGPTFDVGMIAALGVAVGGITAALGALLHAFFGLGAWMPLGVLGLVFLISGPSMAVAWLKLRQRNLGPILDANGWAVNAQTKLNVPLGKSLTQVAVLPPGSQRDLRDPYAERSTPWGVWVTLAVVLLGAGSWYIGAMDRYLPPAAKSTTVLGELAPAANVPEVESEESEAAAPTDG